MLMSDVLSFLPFILLISGSSLGQTISDNKTIAHKLYYPIVLIKVMALLRFLVLPLSQNTHQIGKILFIYQKSLHIIYQSKQAHFESIQCTLWWFIADSNAHLDGWMYCIRQTHSLIAFRNIIHHHSISIFHNSIVLMLSSLPALCTWDYPPNTLQDSFAGKTV